MQWLRFFGLQDATTAERRATLWCSLMFFASLASTFVLRPLRDQFGVKVGVEQFPYLYSLTLLVTATAVPLFWWLANRMPSRRFIPAVLHTCTLAVAALGFGLWVIGDYKWDRLPLLGEAFWGGYSALGVIVPTLVWIHAVEHFPRETAKRLFGLIAVGGTFGAYLGSVAASQLAGHKLPPWSSALLSVLLLQLAAFAFRRSRPHCLAMPSALSAEHIATAGMLAGLAVLARDRRVRWIAVYMLLLGGLATAFYSAQQELVGKEMHTGSAQHAYLANIEEWRQGTVLCLQLFLTGRLMRRVPGVWLLVSLPIVSIFGLSVWWLAPTAMAIFVVQVARGGTQYAFEKPAREVLYTPLDLETKHKVKFLLDTFALRLGDLLGACLQAFMVAKRLQAGTIVLVTMGVAVTWIAVAFALSRDRQRAPTS